MAQGNIKCHIGVQVPTNYRLSCLSTVVCTGRLAAERERRKSPTSMLSAALRMTRSLHNSTYNNNNNKDTRNSSSASESKQAASTKSPPAKKNQPNMCVRCFVDLFSIAIQQHHIRYYLQEIVVVEELPHTFPASSLITAAAPPPPPPLPSLTGEEEIDRPAAEEEDNKAGKCGGNPRKLSVVGGATLCCVEDGLFKNRFPSGRTRTELELSVTKTSLLPLLLLHFDQSEQQLFLPITPPLEVDVRWGFSDRTEDVEWK